MQMILIIQNPFIRVLPGTLLEGCGEPCQIYVGNFCAFEKRSANIHHSAFGHAGTIETCRLSSKFCVLFMSKQFAAGEWLQTQQFLSNIYSQADTGQTYITFSKTIGYTWCYAVTIKIRKSLAARGKCACYT